MSAPGAASYRRLTGTDLVHPGTAGPAPRVLAGADQHSALRAELAGSVRLAGLPLAGVRAALLLVALVVQLGRLGVLRRRSPQVFVESLSDGLSPEIRRRCHVRLP